MTGLGWGREMSRYPYGQQPPSSQDDDFEYDPHFHPMTTQGMPLPTYYQQFGNHPSFLAGGQMQPYSNPDLRYGYPSPYTSHPQYPQHHQQQMQQQPQYQQSSQYQLSQPHVYEATTTPDMVTPTVPSNHPYDTQVVTPFPPYPEAVSFSPRVTSAGPSSAATGYLSPSEPEPTRSSRSTSVASNNSSETQSYSRSDASARSISPSLSEMQQWGFQNEGGRWTCKYPGCSSKVLFTRGCDLRKHYRRHAKTLFCRIEGCPQATMGGFSSKKDRARHEAKHNPGVVCSWEGCGRVFSRVDNMVSRCRRSGIRYLS